MITDREGLLKLLNIISHAPNGKVGAKLIRCWDYELADALISECPGIFSDCAKFIEKDKVMEKIEELRMDYNDKEMLALKHFIESEGK